MERDLGPGFPGIPPARWSKDRSGTLWAYTAPRLTGRSGLGDAPQADVQERMQGWGPQAEIRTPGHPPPVHPGLGDCSLWAGIGRWGWGEDPGGSG